ncbi:MAG TPA: hypothetical protein VIG55_02725 [Methylosinus sp.]|jgi:hypothetical protein
MPIFVIKIVQSDGSLRVPVVANFPTESEAIEAVRKLVGEKDVVTARNLRNDPVLPSLGAPFVAILSVQEGIVAFRNDWTWDGDFTPS